MSWDVFLFDAEGTPSSFESVPRDWRPVPMGDPSAIRDAIDSCTPDVDWSDPEWGVLSGQGLSIEISIGSECPVESVALHVRGSGDVLPTIVRLCKTNRWVAFDTSTGELLDLDRPSEKGCRGFQRFRDRILGPG